MTELERWVDFSVYQGRVGRTQAAAMKADGIAGAYIGSWHGRRANEFCEDNLRDFRLEGLATGTYIIMNDMAGDRAVRLGRDACGSEWPHLQFASVDVELQFSPGIDGERVVRDAFAEVERLGQRYNLYTGNWFMNWWALSLGHLPRLGSPPAIVAVYNGVPDLNIPVVPSYGRLIGHQYTGSTRFHDTTVDFNVLDRDWLYATGGDEMPTQQEWDELKKWQRASATILRAGDAVGTPAYYIIAGEHRHIPGDVWPSLGLDPDEVVTTTVAYIRARAPTSGAPLTVAEAQGIAAGRPLEVIAHENRVRHVEEEHVFNMISDAFTAHEEDMLHAGGADYNDDDARRAISEGWPQP